MALTRADFNSLNSIIMEKWTAEESRYQDYRPMLFDMKTTKRKSEYGYGVGAVGQMTPWAGTVEYDTIEPLYTKTYTMGKYSSGLIFERELLEDEEWGKIEADLKKLAQAKYKTIQTHAASVFNNAFEAGYAGPDAVALCSASHPYSPTDANTQSNYNTLDLTVANLDTVEIAMMNFEDNRGDIMNVRPMEIIVGNALLRDAERIVGSKAEAFVGDNTKNVYSGYKVVHNPFITGKKWFVADPGLREDYLKWFTRREAKLERDDVFDEENIKYKIVGRWAFGWNSWQWVYGNNA